MLSMVSHTSVIPSGAWAPYPIHNMWLMALNRAYEYCTPHVSFWNTKNTQRKRFEMAIHVLQDPQWWSSNWAVINKSSKEVLTTTLKTKTRNCSSRTAYWQWKKPKTQRASSMWESACSLECDSNYTKMLMAYGIMGFSQGKIPASVCLATVTQGNWWDSYLCPASTAVRLHVQAFSIQ